MLVSGGIGWGASLVCPQSLLGHFFEPLTCKPLVFAKSKFSANLTPKFHTHKRISQIKDTFKSTMKAIVVHKPGDSSEMKYEEIPIPEPGEREVSAIVPSRVWRRWEG